MESSYEFLSLVLDSITEHIVVIDEAGEIQFVNKRWLELSL
jgi:PAS domain-containing protein